MNYAEIGYNLGYYGTPILLMLLVIHLVIKFIRKRGEARRAKYRAQLEAQNAAKYNENVFREMERANLLKAQYTVRRDSEELTIDEDEAEAERLEIVENAEE